MKNKMMLIVLGVTAVFLFSACTHTREKAELTVETLSRHETVAEFIGTRYHRCMALTSLCPDRCGHSGILAEFRIIKYLKYEKPGEYGDQKAALFSFMTEDNMHNQKVSDDLLHTTSSLKQDDYVLLFWNHNYVTSAGSSRPERPVVRLQKIATVGSKQWLEQIDLVVNGYAVGKLMPGSEKWFLDVAQKTGVIDSEGHGPDLDSQELKQALNWKLFGIKPK